MIIIYKNRNVYKFLNKLNQNEIIGHLLRDQIYVSNKVLQNIQGKRIPFSTLSTRSVL